MSFRNEFSWSLAANSTAFNLKISSSYKSSCAQEKDDNCRTGTSRLGFPLRGKLFCCIRPCFCGIAEPTVKTKQIGVGHSHMSFLPQNAMALLHLGSETAPKSVQSVARLQCLAQCQTAQKHLGNEPGQTTFETEESGQPKEFVY